MKKMYNLIIIGGGPAGISAGLYAARQNLDTLLITKGFGGQMARKTVAIKNYPGFEEISGLELIQKFEQQLRKQKIDIEFDEVIKLEKIGEKFSISAQSRKQFEAKAVIIATGADPRPLEVPGEKEFIGKGVSYCTACDGPIFKDKVVAVAGGGDAGFEAAIFLSTYAKKIYILEWNSEIKADSENQIAVEETGKVEVMTNVAIKRIQGEKFVNLIIFEDKNKKEEKTLAVDGIFVETGSQPATSFVKNLVDFNERDEIIVDPKTGQTKTRGLFAAGDVDDVPYKQIVVAAGEGAKAAFSVYNYIQKM